MLPITAYDHASGTHLIDTDYHSMSDSEQRSLAVFPAYGLAQSSARNFVCSLIRCRQSPKRTCSLCRACNRVGNGQVGPESRGLRARLGSACVVAVTELVVAEQHPSALAAAEPKTTQ